MSSSNNDGIDHISDPLLELPSERVREGDWVLLHFADGKRVFAQALRKWRGKNPPCKIQKRSYPTTVLIGLTYGSVLEVNRNKLVALKLGEELVPKVEELGGVAVPQFEQANDNRNLVDDNKAQNLKAEELLKLKQGGTDGKKIIKTLMENSSTFDSKTDFAKAKWIVKKQQKYQPRCRLVRCTGRTICAAMYSKDARKMLNLREDTLGQLLSYANISAGSQVLLFENLQGILTGALAQRMGGYGKILSLYTGQQNSFTDMLERFNLSFGENYSIKWLHCEEVFGEDPADKSELDLEAIDRSGLVWPCPLQDHTRKYLETVTDEKQLKEFMAKRCNRFARKLTRTTPMEVRAMLHARPSDSIIIATRHDPTETLFRMLPFLRSSSPFVVFCEYMEPLAKTFVELQRRNVAINLRLSDTWMREYQVLPGRTHPNMNMSQNGGFILMGTKLDSQYGFNEIDEEERKQIREKMGSRRGRKPKHKRPNDHQEENTTSKKPKQRQFL